MKTFDEYIPITKAYEILLFNKINALPINPINIAKTYGFIVNDLMYEPLFVSLKGLTLYNERTNKYAILYNSNFKDFNYTIAHELGHIFLGHYKDGHLVKLGSAQSKRYKQYEKMADLFAHSLILPKPITNSFILNNKFLEKKELINKFSKTFCVNEKIAKSVIQKNLYNSPLNNKLMNIERKILELFKIPI